MELVFVLGRDWKLSLLELASVLKAKGTGFRMVSFNPKACLLSLPNDFDLKGFFALLGGSQKACQVVWKGSRNEFRAGGMQALKKFLDGQYFGKKLLFGVSDYLEEGKGRKETEEAAECLKAHFKANRVKAVQKKAKRHSEEKFKPKQINPKDCISWKLLENGTEFVFSRGAENEVVLSRTIECFNPKGFEERDRQMPYRERLEGISIRLARILANLARAGGGSTVLDPFCGTGTILVEAGLLGLNSIGIELSQERCGNAEKNLAWAKERFGIKNGSRVLCNDCTKLAGFLRKGDFDFVATEPYMGPLISKALSREEAVRIAAGLERTYFDLFRELKKTMPSKGLVAIVLPLIPYFDRMAKAGIAVSDKVWRLNGFEIHNELAELLPGALPYDYMPEKSKIGRRILVLGFRE